MDTDSMNKEHRFCVYLYSNDKPGRHIDTCVHIQMYTKQCTGAHGPLTVSVQGQATEYVLFISQGLCLKDSIFPWRRM